MRKKIAFFVVLWIAIVELAAVAITGAWLVPVFVFATDAPVDRISAGVMSGIVLVILIMADYFLLKKRSS